MEGTDLVKLNQQQIEIGGKLSPSVQVVPNSGERNGSYFVVKKGDCGSVMTIEDRVPQPPARGYKAESLDSVASLVNTFAQRAGGAIETSTPEKPQEPASSEVFVFVGPRRVVALLNEADRRERVTFDMLLSEPMEALIGLTEEEEAEDGPPYAFDQRQAIDFLRRRLNLGTQLSGLISSLRQVKFKQNSQGESKVAVGRESIGRQVEAEMTGAESLPEDVLVRVPYFTNVRDGAAELFEVEVDLCLDTDIAGGKFLLRPKAGEMDNAREIVLAAVQRMLQDAFKHLRNVRVFCGSPE